MSRLRCPRWRWRRLRLRVLGTLNSTALRTVARISLASHPATGSFHYRRRSQRDLCACAAPTTRTNNNNNSNNNRGNPRETVAARIEIDSDSDSVSVLDANWNRETPPCFVFYANRSSKEVEVEAEAVGEEEAGKNNLNDTFRHLRESKNSFLLWHQPHLVLWNLQLDIFGEPNKRNFSHRDIITNITKCSQKSRNNNNNKQRQIENKTQVEKWIMRVCFVCTAMFNVFMCVWEC